MKIGAPARLDELRAHAVYAAACAGLLVFSAAFVGTATAEGLSLPWYEPLQRRWRLASAPPTVVSMDWYARVGLSLLLAGLAAGAVYAFARRRPLPPPILRAAWVWALGMTVLGLFLYAWALGTRVIIAAPH